MHGVRTHAPDAGLWAEQAGWMRVPRAGAGRVREAMLHPPPGPDSRSAEVDLVRGVSLVVGGCPSGGPCERPAPCLR